MLVSPRICFGICPAIFLEICRARQNIKKIMVSRNFRRTHLWEVGPTQILVDHAPLFIVRHVGLHVDFSFTNFFLGL
jgi:hypothetical protein